jgi:sterol desaturase/sphingolipid hydroxylase (fatty acid hydroxylase superfamily)
LVHHAQRELNAFTAFRAHPVDTAVFKSIQFLPLFVLRNGLEGSTVLVFAYVGWTHLVHSNIRTDLGPLRFVFVSPQAHRVHHSIDARHYEHNYGVVFSLWDRLFGTRWHGRDDYPDTGVDDPAFPVEQIDPGWRGVASALRSVARQIAHPLRFRRPPAMSHP